MRAKITVKLRDGSEVKTNRKDTKLEIGTDCPKRWMLIDLAAKDGWAGVYVDGSRITFKHPRTGRMCTNGHGWCKADPSALKSASIILTEKMNELKVRESEMLTITIPPPRIPRTTVCQL